MAALRILLGTCESMLVLLGVAYVLVRSAVGVAYNVQCDEMKIQCRRGALKDIWRITREDDEQFRPIGINNDFMNRLKDYIFDNIKPSHNLTFLTRHVTKNNPQHDRSQ